METIPILTREDVESLDGMLDDYLQKSEAALTVVIDRGGTVIAQRGTMESMDVTIVAALAAGSFAATRELARRVGESEFSALYQQGSHKHIFMSALDENTILITVFGDNTTVGLVRFYTVNLAARLAAFLDTLRHREINADSLPVLEADPSLLAAPIQGGQKL